MSGRPKATQNMRVLNDAPGTASDLALFLWQRPVTGKLDVQGDASLLSRYFALVPPL